jgi:hypothetical protein
MNTLPRALQPWAQPLSLFQRDLALGLAPWIQRLAGAIGALAGSPEAQRGNPDGYDGVARRGPYERLLSTEWLFADAAPMEFLRRAASGEQQFLKLATHEPKATRRCLVLFDAGPSQLGSPRLAHLAALVVFATRCEAAKADLFWGTLQGGPARCEQGFSKERAQALLEGRSGLDPTGEQLDAWLQNPPVLADDLWVVGGREAVLFPRAARMGRLEVSDVLVPDVRRVEVVVHRTLRSALKLELELPPDEACTRLLRAPFAVVKPPRAPVVRAPLAPTSDLVFGLIAARLYMLGAAGELIVMPLPQALPKSIITDRVLDPPPPQRSGRCLVFTPPVGGQIVAAGWRHGPIAIVAFRDESGKVIHFGECHLTRRGELKHSTFMYQLKGRAPQQLAGLREATFQTTRTLIPFDDGLLTLTGREASFDPMKIVASANTATGLATLTCDTSERRFLNLLSPDLQGKSFPIEGSGPPIAFFARNPGVPMPIVATAPEQGTSGWVIHRDGKQRQISVAAGETVVAASHQGLVVQDPNGKLRVRTESSGGLIGTVIGEAENRIIAVCVSFSSDEVAWLDADGCIGLGHLWTGGRVMRGVPVKGTRRINFTSVELGT